MAELRIRPAATSPERFHSDRFIFASISCLQRGGRFRLAIALSHHSVLMLPWSPTMCTYVIGIDLMGRGLDSSVLERHTHSSNSTTCSLSM